MSLLTLIRKNLTLLVRSRGSALTVILGPLLLVVLAGLAFDNTNVYNAKIGTYAPQETPLIKEFITSLAETKFRLQAYPDENACTAGVKTGEVQACVAFSPAFDAANPNNAITFYVDYSRINLVSTIIETLSQHISIKTTELSKNLATSLLNALDTARKAVQERKETTVALATQNDALIKLVAQVQQELGQVDVSVNVESFGAAGIGTAGGELQTQWSNFSLAAEAKLTTIILSLSTLKADLNSTNLSEENKGNLTNITQSIIANATSIRNQLSSTGSGLDTQLQLLNASIRGLTSAVAQAKDRLDTASANTKTAAAQIDGLKQQLDSSLVNILAVQKSFNDIEAAISAVSVSDAGTVSQPVKTTVKPVTARRTYLNYLFPSLLVIVLLFTGVLLAPLLLLVEKHSQAGFRNFMTPVKPWMFSLSIFLTTALILSIQVIIIVAIASGLFSLSLAGVPSLVALFLVLVSLFTLLGMVVGEVFQTEEAATLASILIGSMLLFLSDILIPIETMPQTLATIASYNPVVLGGSLLRKVLLYEGSLTTEFWLLAGYAVILAGVLVFMQAGILQKLSKPKKKA